jgi:hypothetical protein
MISSTSHPVLLFGPQSTEVHVDRLSSIRQVLSTCSSLHDLHDDIVRLESFGSSLETADANLKSIGAKTSSSIISEWMKGNDSAIVEALQSHPNTIATPLTVLNQLLLFFQHWSDSYSLPNRIPITSSTTFGGLCVGQLAATVARLSSDVKEFNRLGSAAVRLAFCIGAYIDLDRHHSGEQNEASCLVVSCPEASDDVQRIREILEGFDTVSALTGLRVSGSANRPFRHIFLFIRTRE